MSLTLTSTHGKPLGRTQTPPPSLEVTLLDVGNTSRPLPSTNDKTQQKGWISLLYIFNKGGFSTHKEVERVTKTLSFEFGFGTKIRIQRFGNINPQTFSFLF